MTYSKSSSGDRSRPLSLSLSPPETSSGTMDEHDNDETVLLAPGRRRGGKKNEQGGEMRENEGNTTATTGLFGFFSSAERKKRRGASGGATADEERGSTEGNRTKRGTLVERENRAYNHNHNQTQTQTQTQHFHAKKTTNLMRQRDLSYAKLLRKYGGGGDVEDGFLGSLGDDLDDDGGSEAPAGPEDLMMHMRRAKRRWPSRRLWLRMGADDGKPTTLAAARMHIIKDLGIQSRDLRFVDSTTATTTSAFIHAREKAIVFCIESLKMIIAADHVLILKESNNNASRGGVRMSMVDAFVQLLSSKLKQRRQDIEMSAFHGGISATTAAARAMDISPSSPASPVSHTSSREKTENDDDDDEEGGGGGENEPKQSPTTVPIPVPAPFTFSSGYTNHPRTRASLLPPDLGNKKRSGTGPASVSSPDLRMLDEADADLLDSDDETMLDFEFVVLDCALEVICAHYEKSALNLRVDLLPALDKLANTVNSVNLDDVKRLKNRASRLMQRVGKVRDELTRFLDDDSDMRQLYLSRKLAILAAEHESLGNVPTPSASARLISRSPPSRQNSLGMETPLAGSLGAGVAAASAGPAAVLHGGIAIDDDSDVLEAENLLEAYFMQIDTIANLLSVLDEHVDDTEDFINIELDFKRNELIQLELLLTTGTFSLAIYSVVAGIFGMNMSSLPNASFSVVIFATLFACALAFLAVLFYCWKRRLLFAR